MDKIVKIRELSEAGLSLARIVSKEESENLRGKIVILKPEESEIGKNLNIKGKGVYGARFK